MSNTYENHRLNTDLLRRMVLDDKVYACRFARDDHTTSQAPLHPQLTVFTDHNSLRVAAILPSVIALNDFHRLLIRHELLLALPYHLDGRSNFVSHLCETRAKVDRGWGGRRKRQAEPKRSCASTRIIEVMWQESLSRGRIRMY